MKGHFYVIKSGDTLSAIAQHSYGRASLWPQIFLCNAVKRKGFPAVLADPNRLPIGATIFVPSKAVALEMPRMPKQPTFPAIVTTAPSGSNGSIRPGSTLPRPSVAHGKQSGATPSGTLVHLQIDTQRTHINSYAFKYELDLAPPIKFEAPDFEWEATYKGQMYIWADTQMPLANVTKVGAEALAKYETDTTLGKMLNSGKLTVDWASKKVSFENLMTVNADGLPPSLVQVGVAMDSKNPNLGIRVKFTWPELSGLLKPNWLYYSRDLQITVDVRPKIKPPLSPGAAQAASASPASLASIITSAPSTNPNVISTAPPMSTQTPIAATNVGMDRPWWDRPSILATGATILVLATLASNVATLGLDSEVDPVSGLAAARLFSMARAAR